MSNENLRVTNRSRLDLTQLELAAVCRQIGKLTICELSEEDAVLLKCAHKKLLAAHKENQHG